MTANWLLITHNNIRLDVFGVIPVLAPHFGELIARRLFFEVDGGKECAANIWVRGNLDMHQVIQKSSLLFEAPSSDVLEWEETRKGWLGTQV